MKPRIVATLAAILALFTITAGTATAAPPKQDVLYTFYDVPLTDADGTTRNYTMSGVVKYNNKAGTAYTNCGYGYRNEAGSMVPVGGHRVEYAIADTSREGIYQYCVENFATRNTRV